MSFDGLIVHKITYSPGRRHDFKIYKMKHPTFLDGLPCGNEKNQGNLRRDHLRHYGDTAYVAMSKAVPGMDYTTPFKRKPGKDLTPEQRAYNRVHSRVRIHVENGIREGEGLPDHEEDVQKQAEKVRSHQQTIYVIGNFLS